MKIELSNPHNEYVAQTDTGAMAVEITKNFTGVAFVSEDGEVLHVAQRDAGFEIIYIAQGQTHDVEMKDGYVRDELVHP